MTHGQQRRARHRQKHPPTRQEVESFNAAIDFRWSAQAGDVFAGHYRTRRGFFTWRKYGRLDWLLINTVAGRGWVEHTGGLVEVRGGDVVLIPPSAQHHYGAAETGKGWEVQWAHFEARPEWIAWLDWPADGPGLRRLCFNEPARRSVMQRRFAAMLEMLQVQHPCRDRLVINGLEAVLLWCQAANPRWQEHRLDTRVQAATDYVRANLARDIRLDELAQTANVSVSRLCHLFRDEMNQTPQQHIERLRLDRARELLAQTSYSVKTIAAEVGFRSPFYFSRRFKRDTGRSPSAYRAAPR